MWWLVSTDSDIYPLLTSVGCTFVTKKIDFYFSVYLFDFYLFVSNLVCLLSLLSASVLRAVFVVFYVFVSGPYCRLLGMVRCH